MAEATFEWRCDARLEPQRRLFAAKKNLLWADDRWKPEERAAFLFSFTLVKKKPTAVKLQRGARGTRNNKLGGAARNWKGKI